MKPLLVGESNPYQVHPHLSQRFALYPHPPRCAGWNLCHKIMQLDEREYLARFDRVNLCDGKWSMREAKERAASILDGPYRTVIAFGAKVTAAFGFKFEPFKAWLGGIIILPHPSGLSRAWNEPGAYERARSVLREAGVL